MGKVRFHRVVSMKYLAYKVLGLWKMNYTFAGTARSMKDALIKITGVGSLVNAERMPG